MLGAAPAHETSLGFHSRADLMALVSSFEWKREAVAKLLAAREFLIGPLDRRRRRHVERIRMNKLRP